jgi:hypothetical protein
MQIEQEKHRKMNPLYSDKSVESEITMFLPLTIEEQKLNKFEVRTRRLHLARLFSRPA